MLNVMLYVISYIDIHSLQKFVVVAQDMSATPNQRWGLYDLEENVYKWQNPIQVT